MTLPEICIKRPVFATVLSLGVLLIGLIAYERLPVREYPKIDEPVVSVSTTYRGASADVMESQVTKPLEDSLSGIEGVDVITSTSRSEVSEINIRFTLKRDPDSAAADVRDKVARVRNRLPQAVDESVIAKQEADAQPIIYLAFSSDRHSQMEISDYVSRYVKPRLQTIAGVADVLVFGERRISMRIWLDRAKLAAYRLTPQDVEEAIRRQNVEVPAGRIESQRREFTVLSQTDLATPEEFGNVVIRDVAGYPVRVKDVARVELGPVNERVITRYNGASAVGMGVIRQATANPLEISRSLRGEIEKINKGVPQGMKFELSFDSSVFIERSVKAVFKTIGEAILLVALVIFAFLRSFRATLIPLVTIPVSLVGAFALMYAFGFTVNTLTLLAMVLAIGLVVDDAIVVLENIHRKMEHGMSRLQAAIEGSREIAFAVIAMTLTLAAVYAPLAFSTGRTGRLFIEFALTLAGAVLVSGFVALTLSPMMCSQILRYRTEHNAWYNAMERFFQAMTRTYKHGLTASLKRRWIAAVLWLFFVAAAVPLMLNIKEELAPLEDRGVIFGRLVAPEGSTTAYTLDYVKRIEQFYEQVPEMARYFTVVGRGSPSEAFAVLRLKDWEDRTRRQQAVTNELRPKFATLPGVLAFAIDPASLGQGPNVPLQFVIMTQASYEELNRMIERIVEEARKNRGLINPDSDLRLNKPELKVSVNRDKMSDVGVPVEAASRTVETMLGGRLTTRFKRDGEQYDVIVQVADVDRASPDDITAIYVRGKNNEMIQLSNLVNVRESVAPRSLNHFNRLRSATISASLTPGYSLGEAVKFMEETTAKVAPSVQTDLAGQARESRAASQEQLIAFILALAFIYLVLAAQFESFIDPLVIMLTVPLAVTGALLALHLTGGTLNVYSRIGLITLIGLITKHGILIVEFANQLQERGMSKLEAVIEASVLRLRPILMTTGAMVLGALPLALATGAGAESRQQIGWVVVGGLMLGTLLTLLVVPTAYTVLARKRKPVTEALPTLADAQSSQAD